MQKHFCKEAIMTNINDFEIENGTLKRYHGKESHVIIPDCVTTVDSFAFQDCTDLISVTIPDSVRKIMLCVFNDCTNLRSVKIGKNVEVVALSGAFGACGSLSSIEVSEENQHFYSKNNCLIRRDMQTLLVGCQSSAIPEDVLRIGTNAFSYCESLHSIVIPEGVKKIGWCAFSHCTSLSHVVIPSSVDSLGAYAFVGCNNLRSIEVSAENECYYSQGNYVVKRASNTVVVACKDAVIPEGLHIESSAFTDEKDT